MGNFIKNKDFFSAIFKFALPITLEILIGYSINAIDTVMVGRLGEISIAAVGIANQVFYLLTFVFIGICNASIIFTSQFWGKKDIKNIRKVLSICLTVSISGALIFSVAAVLFPKIIVGIFTSNTSLIDLGSEYLRIIGFSYIVTAISSSYLALLKSTGNVILPLVLSAMTLIFNTILNYVLIYGKFGFPAMGVSGSATATCIVRYAECFILLLCIYIKRYPLAASLKELLDFDMSFVKRYFKVSLPVVFNDVIWSLGVVTYNWVYARIGVESIAAINICSSIEALFTVLFIGMTNTCSILIGNYIGSNAEDKAFTCGKNFLNLCIIGSILAGCIMIVSAKGILSFYTLSVIAYKNAYYVMVITGCILWIKVSNMMLIAGIIRSGGDTKFSMVLDLATIWIIGIPMALLGAFVFHLTVYWVVLLVMADEVIKMIGGLKRFFSKKWINNVAVNVK